MSALATYTGTTELLPGYQIREHLARGRMLDIYTVWSEHRQCLCIAKTIRPDRRDEETVRARLVREGQYLQRLSHPHLVRCFEVHSEHVPVMILETLPGQTLSHLMSERRVGLDAADVVELGAQLCSVLTYLHRENVLHLDLKPSNVIVRAGSALLIDLSHAGPPGRSEPGLGTPEYMAPEQLAGDRVTTATDVWGLGGVLYRAATRRRPFGLGARARSSPPVTPLRRRAIDLGVIHMIEACFESEPRNRPGLAQVRDILDAAG